MGVIREVLCSWQEDGCARCGLGVMGGWYGDDALGASFTLGAGRVGRRGSARMADDAIASKQVSNLMVDKACRD